MLWRYLIWLTKCYLAKVVKTTTKSNANNILYITKKSHARKKMPQSWVGCKKSLIAYVSEQPHMGFSDAFGFT